MEYLMGDFHQNGVVSTLHDFGTKSIDDMEAELKVFSGYRPMELILPSLYSELEGPALRNIVDQISQVDYLNHVVIGWIKQTVVSTRGLFRFSNSLISPFRFFGMTDLGSRLSKPN
jgi:glucosyl-3-phosphoglycerate synthase